MSHFYVDTIPAYLAPLVEREVRGVVERAKAQHAGYAPDHFMRAGADESPVLVSILYGASAEPVTESLVQREMRRAG